MQPEPHACSPSRPPVSPAPGGRAEFDPAAIDVEGFGRAVEALRLEAEGRLGPADYAHLLRLERWGRAASAAGYATAWVAPNPFSAAAIALGSSVRWTIVAHHVSHRGFDRIAGVPEHHRSTGFAQGGRRLLDWFDWMLPAAWHHEHDVLHHFHTGEPDDPDLVEENARSLRESRLPLPLKLGAVAFYALTWKFTYYAPNTFQILKRAEQRRSRAAEARAPGAAAAGPAPHAAPAEGAAAPPGAPASVNAEARGDEAYLAVFDPRTPDGRAFWRQCLLPYGLGRFVALPALYAPLGPWAVFSVWANSVGAELLTNLHTFVIIAPNHAGDDVFRFERPARGKAELQLRQVLGSVNYRTGSELGDFLQGFLNYQIEHHLFPTLPPLKLRELQPRVKALCAAFGVPYRQEPLHRRVRQLVGIMVGRASHPRLG